MKVKTETMAVVGKPRKKIEVFSTLYVDTRGGVECKALEAIMMTMMRVYVKQITNTHGAR